MNEEKEIFGSCNPRVGKEILVTIEEKDLSKFGKFYTMI